MTDSFKIPDLHLFGSRRRTYETVRNIDCNFRD